MSDNSRKLVVKGVFWSGVQMVINASFSFGIKLVLAKILFPEDFGVVGMATVFTGFVQVLNDLGIAAALVQRKEEELREDHFHTAFWTGVIWGVSLYIIMCFVVGPLASIFYEEPLLKSLIPVLSLGILASPVNMVHKAQLTRAMNFKKLALIENASAIVSGVLALALALLGAGVWSLAFNTVALVVVAMPLYFKATGWKPKRIWSRDAFIDVFGFGLYTAGTKIVNYAINNVDYMLIGKLVSANALGVYTFAFVLTDTFRSRLMSVINNVMYPMYGKKQSDPASLKRYYLKVVNYNALVIFPIMLTFIIEGEPILINFFGEKWADSVVPLRLLSMAVMVHMMVNSNTALIRGMGRPSLELKLQIFKALIFIPTLVLGIVYYGIVGAATAVLINKVIAVIIAQYTFNRILDMDIGTLEFLKAIKVPWIASIVAGGVVYLLNNMVNLNYILAVIALFLVYGIVVWLFMRDEIEVQIKELKASKTKK